MQADQSRTTLAKVEQTSHPGPAFTTEASSPFTRSSPIQAGRARRSTASRGSLANGPGLAHDAGNLLGALRLYAELMSVPGVLYEQHRHLARELSVLSDRSSVLLDRLVAAAAGVSESAGAETPVVGEDLVLPESVLDCLGLLSKIAGRPVTFFCAPSAYAPVAVPREAFERIVVNLVKNAAEASPRGETIAVTLLGTPSREGEPRGMRMLLTVRDSGRGMSQGAIRQLFEAERPQPGARHGLGFQIVRELAESSGGSVEVESQPGAGTSVMLSWPLAPLHSSGAPAAASRIRTVPPNLPGKSGGKARFQA